MSSELHKYIETSIEKREKILNAEVLNFPNEKRYQYHPFIGLEDRYRWNQENYDKVIRDYNLQDLAI